ncbi:hypothetical protein E1261_11975 [Kribbella albertanoniae]|uniref:DUF7660 domain-containing protein n=1 Tax=Kribbella albertanoniae TaxID=1266829 RepID=A0A4R4Q727_9ACTN|nr:hypothetical protein E1261_11975 [Kribbella albertanoniae]
MRTRDDLAHFLRVAMADLQARPRKWENSTLERFLEAWAAWVEDLPGWYANRGADVPDQPDWNLVANMVLAARIYE